MTLFAHGPITEKEGDRGKCRKCGQWYDIPEGASCVPSHCQLWNPECWHPPKALGPNHVGWLLGAIPLYNHLEPVPDPNTPELFWVPKGFPPGCMGPYVHKDGTPDFDPGHENLSQAAAKELCPDGVTEKEPDHEGNAQAGGKYCDPEE